MQFPVKIVHVDEADFANTLNSKDETVHHSYIGPEMPDTQIKDGVHYDTQKPATTTGTGFDIISLCSANTGVVMVSVYKGEVENLDKSPFDDRYITSYMVDTHYSYVYNIEMGRWE